MWLPIIGSTFHDLIKLLRVIFIAESEGLGYTYNVSGGGLSHLCYTLFRLGVMVQVCLFIYIELFVCTKIKH